MCHYGGTSDSSVHAVPNPNPTYNYHSSLPLPLDGPLGPTGITDNAFLNTSLDIAADCDEYYSNNVPTVSQDDKMSKRDSIISIMFAWSSILFLIATIFYLIVIPELEYKRCIVPSLFITSLFIIDVLLWFTRSFSEEYKNLSRAMLGIILALLFSFNIDVCTYPPKHYGMCAISATTIFVNIIMAMLSQLLCKFSLFHINYEWPPGVA